MDKKLNPPVRVIKIKWVIGNALLTHLIFMTLFNLWPITQYLILADNSLSIFLNK